MRPSLAELQERFYLCVTQAGAGRVEGGLGVYARMYFVRQLDVLREDFEHVADLIGERAFETLVADYLAAHPSESPTLHHLGRAFADFAHDHAVARDRSDVGDLARLEWARAEVFDDADAPALERAHLQGVAAERWPEILLRLVPAARFVDTTFAADDVWGAVDRGEPAAAPQADARRLLVWRLGDTVRHRALAREEREALRLVASGATFAAVCDAFASEAAPAEQAARRAYAALAQWITDGLLAR